ncbi:DUF2846 domain-containing protein [Chitinolyticbacter albus]|uniref:DUF2846 domain-containing protein n=1 Tax=Chitinolyticbacter albus TaxID=2961951 RepID=UPI00210BA5AE|nr:DUF2846 domain-containing protein [Chitinolyticbacter albus]
MMKWIATVCAAAAMVAFSGCASVPSAPAAVEAAAKQFAPKEGKANVYVYRNETLGAAITMPVALDGQQAGETAAKTFFAFEVEPGQHELASEAENTSKLDLTVEAGKSYYVWQEVKMGVLMAGSKLQQVDEAIGKAGVLECKMIDSPLPAPGAN